MRWLGGVAAALALGAAQQALAVPVELVSGDAHGNVRGYASKEPSISADGRFVAFSTGARLLHADTNGLNDVYLRDRNTGHLTLVSVSSHGTPGKGKSYAPSISA